ncbi:unnamed protein product [Urochloa decumbens]|uniref:Rx N-terminal domain-containing protein n=1 Tax=Urochloa decumbens TaxID=240449 RepID=A0ABC9D6P4_9POAL
MAGAAGFAAAALERAIGALSSLLLPGFTAVARGGEADADAEEELRRLGRTMRRIRAALEDADDGRAAGPASAAASLRLRELRRVAYDAEDVVGECEYEAARRGAAEALDPVRRAGSGGCLKRARREVIGDCFNGIDTVPVVRDLAARARKIRARFNEIIKEYEDLCMTDNDGEQQIDLATQSSLRSVILSSKDGVGGPVEIPEELFLHSKQLRTIVFDGVSLARPSLPDSVGNLKHLRHLVLRDIGGLRLPTSICQLFNLQTLDVTTSGNLKPACIPNGIGCLVNLHTLPVITIKRGAWHCNLRELKDLQNLSGKLCIKGLDNVTNVDEVEEANLCAKQHLQALNLTFPDEDWQYCEHGQEPALSTASHEEILESLRPHSHLIELSIEVSRSCRYPNWLGDTSFTNLTLIRLEYCEFECMPPLGQLPALKHLTIAEMARIERIGLEFCSLNPRIKGFKSLVTLEFEWMPRWLQWSGVGDGAFTSLHTFSIHHASELRSLPCALSSSLAELKLRDCTGLVRIPYLPSLLKMDLRQCNGLTELPAFPLLHKLDIGQCSSLARLPSLPLLKVLILRDCPNLTAAAHFPSLTSIHVKGGFRDELLYHLMNCHPSLENILIVSESIVHLSVEPQNLPSLASLRLSCPNLQCCDGLDGLTSLTELRIYGCIKLIISRETKNIYTLIITQHQAMLNGFGSF